MRCNACASARRRLRDNWRRFLQVESNLSLKLTAFVRFGQIASMLTALGFLIAGPLADKRLESVQDPTVWGAVCQVVGDLRETS